MRETGTVSYSPNLLISWRLTRLNRIGRSPLTTIYDITCPNHGELRAIDTCRIFEDSFDFCDENGDGWYILKKISRGGLPFGFFCVEEKLAFLSWFVNLSSLDIKANYSIKNIMNVMGNADKYFADAVGLLPRLCPPLDEFEYSLPAKDILLFRLVENQKWTYASILLGLGANPHQVYFVEHHSPIAESPLSLAMYSSWTFWAFRNTLHGTNLDVEEIVREELKEGRPLLEAGWRMETLRTLLELKFEPELEEQSWWSFDCCRTPIENHDVPVETPVQPYWQGILKQIKIGTYQQSIYSDCHKNVPSPFFHDRWPLSIRLKCSKKDNMIKAANGSTVYQDPIIVEDEAMQLDEEAFGSEQDTSSMLFTSEDIWCIWCWYQFRETGQRPSPAISKRHSRNREDSSEHDSSEHDSSEHDFSPYLFNT